MSKPERVPADGALHLTAAFDIGPTRTMQQDVEFGVLRFFVPWMSFDGLLDTAFEQIRHYAAADVAVSLRRAAARNSGTAAASG